MPAKMPGKFEKGDVLFAHVVQNADRAGRSAGQPDDLAPGAAELALQRQYLLGRRVEMLLEELFENVHEDATKITSNRDAKTETRAVLDELPLLASPRDFSLEGSSVDHQWTLIRLQMRCAQDGFAS